MRLLSATLVGLFAVSIGSTAWAQGSDPFGGEDPFGGRPVARQPRHARPTGTARDAMIEQAKQVLADGRKPVQVAPSRQHDAERRIHAALGSQTTITLIETPLQEAMQVFSRNHDIPIVIDSRALEEIGLDSNVGVNIDLRNVTLRSALRLLLRDLDLTYMIRDEVMQITTVEAAENNLVLEMYVLPDHLAEKADQVIKVLTATVVPDTWETLGGPSTAMPLDHVLVVSATSDVHDQVEDFLSMLVQKYGK
jgi:hypothetical protein